ncbi:MerR family transcriptional regulator [Microbacterium lushaniae]|uniref:MerR family transcriptional regulator n=1 Tax=Microbacterium lushaniae TaxID=2614639 RepID=A0A5J6L375_9MICO|nr:MerR family transcriptional regulator [Microbacterium lushaniae]QEW02927.1 MerR family transcriptional regulator [Microbacterium lushaniae]
MRISELSAAAGVPVPTIKYYLREKLLPEGNRTSATQASYDDAHLQRLRVIRALIESGVSIAETRKVIAALDAPPPTPYELLGVAHAAVAPGAEDGIDTAEAEKLFAQLGGEADQCDPAQLAGLAQALRNVERSGFQIPPDVLTAYVAAARQIAEAEIAGIPTDSLESVVRYVVLGTVLPEQVLLALRRVAEQIVSAERYGRDAG